MSLKSKLPQYQCHKVVRAAQIYDIIDSPDAPCVDLHVRMPNGIFSMHGIQVSRQYIAKHNPKVGGYYVLYDDGYESFSPATAFETGYSLVTQFAQLDKESE